MRRTLSRSADAEISQRALRNMHLAFDRARKRNAFPWWASRGWRLKKQFLKIYRKGALKTHFQKSGTSWHVDHIVPLAGDNVCGLMVPWNLHVIPAVTNIAKSTMLVPEWIERDVEAERIATVEKRQREHQRYKSDRDYWREKNRRRMGLY